MRARDQIHHFFEPLLNRNPSGTDWLGPLLRATPDGEAALGAELIEHPGHLHADLTMPALERRRTCFHYPVAAPPELTEWFLEHPGRLSWPEQPEPELSPESLALRRALLHDEPPGSREKAQHRARDLVSVRSVFAREWWRFEETFELDCLLTSDRLVLSFLGTGTELDPVSAWYPQRSKLHRALEAASRLAGDRAWGTVVLCDAPVPAAAEESAVRDSLPGAAPHLDVDGLDRLAAGYLGAITWASAQATVDAALAQR